MLFLPQSPKRDKLFPKRTWLKEKLKLNSLCCVNNALRKAYLSLNLHDCQNQQSKAPITDMLFDCMDGCTTPIQKSLKHYEEVSQSFKPSFYLKIAPKQHNCWNVFLKIAYILCLTLIRTYLTLYFPGVTQAAWTYVVILAVKGQKP